MRTKIAVTALLFLSVISFFITSIEYIDVIETVEVVDEFGGVWTETIVVTYTISE